MNKFYLMSAVALVIASPSLASNNNECRGNECGGDEGGNGGEGGQGGIGGSGGVGVGVGIGVGVSSSNATAGAIASTGPVRNDNTNLNANSNKNDIDNRNISSTLGVNVSKNDITNAVENTVGNTLGNVGSTSSTANANNSSVVVEGDEAQRRNPVSTAYSTHLVAGSDTCMGSTSMGAQGIGFGVSFGSTWTDKNCMRIKNSRELVGLGQQAAAVQLLCIDKDVRRAMIAAGTPCKN